MEEIILEGEQANYAFNPYDKANFLGSGGMGKVFVGKVSRINNNSLSEEELKVGDKVAIKVIHRELTNNRGVIKRAYRESLIRIRHPNLILMLDFVNLNNTFHIISKFIEGTTLSRMLRENEFKPIIEEQSLHIIQQVFSGLKSLHDSDIIHRDIKPSNICLTSKGEAVIMDLGVAKVSDGRRLSVTGVGSILGTPHYSSPEQVLGETEKISAASDLYSTGVTLYELLTGSSPYQSDSEWEVIKMQVKEPLPEVSIINKKLFKIIRKVTEKDVKNRYKDAGHVMEDINNYINPPQGFANKIKYLINRLRR